MKSNKGVPNACMNLVFEFLTEQEIAACNQVNKSWKKETLTTAISTAEKETQAFINNSVTMLKAERYEKLAQQIKEVPIDKIKTAKSLKELQENLENIQEQVLHLIYKYAHQQAPPTSTILNHLAEKFSDVEGSKQIKAFSNFNTNVDILCSIANHCELGEDTSVEKTDGLTEIKKQINLAKAHKWVISFIDRISDHHEIDQILGIVIQTACESQGQWQPPTWLENQINKCKNTYIKEVGLILLSEKFTYESHNIPTDWCQPGEHICYSPLEILIGSKELSPEILCKALELRLCRIQDVRNRAPLLKDLLAVSANNNWTNIIETLIHNSRLDLLLKLRQLHIALSEKSIVEKIISENKAEDAKRFIELAYAQKLRENLKDFSGSYGVLIAHYIKNGEKAKAIELIDNVAKIQEDTREHLLYHLILELFKNNEKEEAYKYLEMLTKEQPILLEQMIRHAIEKEDLESAWKLTLKIGECHYKEKMFHAILESAAFNSKPIEYKREKYLIIGKMFFTREYLSMVKSTEFRWNLNFNLGLFRNIVKELEKQKFEKELVELFGYLPKPKLKNYTLPHMHLLLIFKKCQASEIKTEWINLIETDMKYYLRSEVRFAHQYKKGCAEIYAFIAEENDLDFATKAVVDPLNNPENHRTRILNRFVEEFTKLGKTDQATLLRNSVPQI